MTHDAPNGYAYYDTREYDRHNDRRERSQSPRPPAAHWNENSERGSNRHNNSSSRLKRSRSRSSPPNSPQSFCLVHTETAADVPTEATAEVMVVTMEAAKIQYGTNHTDPLDTPAKVKVHHLDIDTDGGIGMGKHLIIAKLAYRRTSQHMRIEQDIILATVGHAKRLGPTVSTRSSPKGRLSLASVVPYRMDKVTVPYYLPLGQL